MTWKIVFPLITSGIAMLMDIKTTRVDNGWLVFMLGVEVFIRVYAEGWKSMLSFSAGVLCPLFFLMFLYCFRMLGPGDIKLLCVLGGMLGVRKIGMLIVYAFFIGAAISVLILIFWGDIKARMRYFLSYIKDYSGTGEIKPYYKKGMTLENFHFTVPIFLSTVLYAGGIF